MANVGVFAFTAAFAAAIGGSALAAEPVKVAVATVTHKASFGPYSQESNRTLEPPRTVTDPIAAKLKQRQAAFDKEYDAAHAEAAQSAAAAYDQYRAIPRQQQQSNAAAALLGKYEGYRAARDAARRADPACAELDEELRAARNSTVRISDITFPVVTLNNGLVEVKVVPTLGMRVWNAVDLASNTSFAGTPGPRDPEKAVLQGNCGWTAGYLEPSFPSFEHGMFVLDQPAGWRIIKDADGGVTVAMDMRFTHHQHKRNLARYGRYGDQPLSGWVTLRPGQARYSITYRVENPNPLRRSNRLWVNFILHADGYDAAHILYPVGWHTGHGASGFSPVWGEGGPPKLRGVSMFAVHPDYDFAGVYSKARDVNCLLVKDRSAPGLKLYTTGAEGGVMEIWTGTNEVFEHSGWFLDPYLPMQQTLVCYNVAGLGRVSFATGDLAIAASAEGGSFKLYCPVPGKVEVSDGGGGQLASGDAGPGKIIRGTACDRLVVKIDGREAADVTFPLKHADVSKTYEEKVKPLGGKCRAELEVVAGNHGTVQPQSMIAFAQEILGPTRPVGSGPSRPGGRDEAQPRVDLDTLVSAANCCYRLGRLDTAAKLCERIGKSPETDYLRGLIAWEHGEKVDFGSAGLDAHYHRAMLAIQAGKTDAAAALLKELLAARPAAFRPALMLAYLTKDARLAAAQAAANPGSPEAQLVLELLGVEGAKQAKDSLLNNNPSAPEQVEAFRLELTAGKWRHMKRFELLGPQ
jgi:hypothetical protein